MTIIAAFFYYRAAAWVFLLSISHAFLSHKYYKVSACFLIFSTVDIIQSASVSVHDIFPHQKLLSPFDIQAMRSTKGAIRIYRDRLKELKRNKGRWWCTQLTHFFLLSVVDNFLWKRTKVSPDKKRKKRKRLVKGKSIFVDERFHFFFFIFS